MIDLDPRLLPLLDEQQRKGERLLARLKDPTDNLGSIRKEVISWDRATRALAQKVGVEQVFPQHNYGPNPLFETEEDRSSHIDVLEQALSDLSALIDLVKRTTTVSSTADIPLNTRRVFVVHGQNEAARESVARFLERLGLEAVILHEQPNVGRTIIEKIEEHSDVGYAVVLLTADDEGGARGAGPLKPRARQNVVFEAGVFMGKLGRERVALMYEPGVELPSDLQGLVYIELDRAGGWEKRLFVELRNAEMEVSEERWLGSPK